MDEQQLRGLVRDAIARHLGPSAAAPASPAVRSLVPAGMGSDPVTNARPAIAVTFFDLPRRPGEVECVIEPTVTCNHCGHCLCYGH